MAALGQSKTYKLSVFRWNPYKKTLRLKRTLPWGDFPYELWIQGKHNRVQFRHTDTDATKKLAIYEYKQTDGTPNPHIDQSIKVIIGWK